MNSSCEHVATLQPASKFDRLERVQRETSGGKPYDVLRGIKANGKSGDVSYCYSPAIWTVADARAHATGNRGTFHMAKPNKPIEIKLIANGSISNAAIREEMYNGRPHLVVPIVALVEGVHKGAYYPASELGKVPQAWNGVPITINHPRNDKGVLVSASSTPDIAESVRVGQYFAAAYDAALAKLRGEAWVDIAKTQATAPALLTALRAGQPVEVSTGLWSDADGVSGMWNDEAYSTTYYNFRPDHLALLPGGTGACSWADGCGVRVNAEGEEESMETNAMIAALREAHYTVLELSHSDIRDLLRSTIAAKVGKSVWLVEVYDSYCIYEISGTVEAVGSNADKYYRVGYELKGETEIALSDTVIEVIRKTEFVEVIANENTPAPVTNSAAGSNGKETDMETNDKLVAALIANEKTQFECADAEWLKTLSAEQLGKLNVLEEAPPVETPAETPAPTPAAETPATDTPATDAPATDEPAEEPKALSRDEFIATAPEEFRDVLTNAVKGIDEAKAATVKAILANEKNAYTEEQLNAKDAAELSQIAALAAVEEIVPDYSGRGGGPAPISNADNDAPDPMPAVFETKK